MRPFSSGFITFLFTCTCSCLFFLDEVKTWQTSFTISQIYSYCAYELLIVERHSNKVLWFTIYWQLWKNYYHPIILLMLRTAKLVNAPLRNVSKTIKEQFRNTESSSVVTLGTHAHVNLNSLIIQRKNVRVTSEFHNKLFLRSRILSSSYAIMKSWLSIKMLLMTIIQVDTIQGQLAVAIKW